MDFRKPLFGLALTTTLLGAASSAQAQLKTGPIDIQFFRPATDSKGYFTLNGAQILAPLDASFGLVSTLALRPLEIKGVYGASQPSAVKVSTLITTTLQGAVGLLQMDHLGLQVGMALPITVLSGEGTPQDEKNPSLINDNVRHQFDAQGIGDLVIYPKFRLINPSRKKIGVSVLPSFVLPTGNKDRFMEIGRAHV
jgi:hypothetical protein